jgi:flagellar biosynthesis component FlhA
LLRFGLALEMEMEACWSKGRRPVMIVNPKIRGHIAELFRRSYPHLAVLSWAEVPGEVQVETVATLGSQVHPLASPWNRESYIYPVTKRRRL